MKLRIPIIACCDVFVPVAKETRHHIIKWAMHISICVNSKKLNKIQKYHTVIAVHSNQGNQCCNTELYDREHSHINITGRTMCLFRTLWNINSHIDITGRTMLLYRKLWNTNSHINITGRTMLLYRTLWSWTLCIRDREVAICLLILLKRADGLDHLLSIR